MKIGLTGGLASGKSTIAARLRESGLMVVDADQLVAELYTPGGAGVEAVRELFGDAVISESEAVDSEKLAAIVFADPEALDRLEARIHPLVREAFSKLAESTTEPIVLEGTLLVEAGYAPHFDLLVSVEAPVDVRLQRAIDRGLSPDQASARLEAQGDGELRRRAADRIIANDGTLDELLEKADALAQWIRGEERA